MNYEETVEYILSIPKFTKKNKIENTVELMERLGGPDRFMKIIHVAGTNGKGSVCAFLSSILTEAGKSTGLFTSPHLVKINERFQINSESISDEDFLGAYQKVDNVIQDMQKDGFAHPTYFELLFAVAMMAFYQAGVEYVILETGLGGRLDATNVIRNPIAVVLTTMGLDHTEILGDTIEKITWEKAGIIKPGVPVIYDGRDQKAEEVIIKQAEQLKAPQVPLYEQMYEILGSTDKSIDFLFNNGYYDHTEVKVPYPAKYQVVNSALALLTMQIIDPKKQIPISKRIEGILHTGWQGRMETVMPGVIMDGAHNLSGVKEFISTVRCTAKNRKIVILFSAVAEKNYQDMIAMICHEANPDAVVVTQVKSDRMVAAKTLAEVFQKYTDVPVYAKENISEAFLLALKEKGDGLLFCVGSLYLIGELKILIEHMTPATYNIE